MQLFFLSLTLPGFPSPGFYAHLEYGIKNLSELVCGVFVSCKKKKMHTRGDVDAFAEEVMLWRTLKSCENCFKLTASIQFSHIAYRNCDMRSQPSQTHTLISTCQAVRYQGDCLFCLRFVTSTSFEFYYTRVMIRDLRHRQPTKN